MTNKDFYTINEAAELLRVNPRTVYNLVNKKQIAHYRVGKQIRISAEEISKLKVPADPKTISD